MKLTKREVEILEFLLGKTANTAEIASTLAIKKSNLSRYLRKLSDNHLIIVKKKGRHRIISLEPFISTSFPSARLNFSFLKLGDILVGWMPYLLSFARNKREFTLSDIDLPIATSKRLLSKLRSIGIIYMCKRGIYELRKEALRVAEFCSNLLVYIYGIKIAFEVSKWVVYRSSFDSAKTIGIVFSTENEVRSKGYWPTSFSVFNRYRINLISAGNFYYTNTKPDILDIVIHTLAFSNDARNISYVSALMLKNSVNPKRLLKKRQLFGLGKEFIEGLIKFLETKGQFMPAGFPTWEEVEGVLNE